MKTKLLLLAFFAQLFALNASANFYGVQVNGIMYNLYDDSHTATVTSTSGGYYSGNIIIPTEITYRNTRYRVTSIISGAFKNCTSLTSVEIPSSISEIGAGAFMGCTSLTSIVIPSSVIKIRLDTFSGCTTLSSITIPKSVTLIEADAFFNTKWYKEWIAKQQDGPCYINDHILLRYKGSMPANCTFQVKEGTVCIAGRAFEDCPNLVSIVIPESVRNIGSYAFSRCSNLKSIKWPKTLDYMGGVLFNKCVCLTHMDMPSYIEEKTGQNGVGFQVAGDSVQRTAWGFEFYGCNNLRRVSLAEGTTMVRGYMFWKCTNLTTISLPASIQDINIYNSFKECPNLTNVYVRMPNPVTIQSETFPTRYTSTLYVPKGSKAAYQSAEYWSDFQDIIEINPITSISLPETVELMQRSSTMLTAKILPDNSNNYLKWESSDENVVMVEDGMLTAVGVGTAIITASATDGSGVSATCEVTVVGSGQGTDISQMNNIIYLGTAKAGEGSAATLSFNMKNSAVIRGFQFDLYLPEGISVVKNAKGRIQASLSSGRLPEDDEHTLTVTEQTDGAIRFLCGSQYDETFTGNEGELITLQVNIDEALPVGDYPVILKDMRLSETDISKFYDTKRIVSILTFPLYIPGDINGDGVVNVSDYIGIANHILGIPQEGFIEKAGDVNEDDVINVSDYIGLANFILTGSFYGGRNSNVKAAHMPAKATDLNAKDNVIFVEPLIISGEPQEATLSIQMKNTVAIRGFQFDLYLPEGVTAVKNAKGRIQASLSNGRLPEDDEHTLTVQSQADGAIRFLCGSQYDETFTGTSGEIATLKVNIAEGLTDGSYPIVLKNMRLSETDISKYYDWDEVETTITVDFIDSIDFETASSSQYYNLAGHRIASPARGVNIIRSADGTTKKVLIK